MNKTYQDPKMIVSPMMDNNSFNEFNFQNHSSEENNQNNQVHSVNYNGSVVQMGEANMGGYSNAASQVNDQLMGFEDIK